MSGNAGGAAAKSRRHMKQRHGLPYAREAPVTRANTPCANSSSTPGGSTLFRVAGFVARRVPILRHWWSNADGEQPQHENELSDDDDDDENAQFQLVREEDPEAAEQMRDTLAALSKKLSPSQFRACLREVGADVAQSPSKVEPVAGMGAEAYARIMAQAPRSPAIEAMACPPAPEPEAMVAPSPVDTPYAHVRSLMHEGMQRRRRAVAACRAPPSTGAPMYGGLPVLNATRLRQSADNAFATPFPRTAVRTGMTAPSTSVAKGAYSAETPGGARVAGFSSYGPLLTRTQPRSSYFASAESPAPAAGNSIAGWGTPMLPRTAGGLTMLKRRRGAMDDEAEQPDFAPPPTTLRRLNLAMDASPAINQATPGFRETAAPASNVVTTDTARRILQTLDRLTAPMDPSPSKTAADSSTPAHVASNASSDAFPPPPTAALPQFALEKAGVQGAPSMRVNPAPVYGGPPSTSGPSSFGFGAGVGDSTLEKRGGTETPSAPSTSLPPLAQSSPGFGFQNSLNSNGIPAAQPCNGPKNAPTSFFTPSTGADTNVSLKIGDNSGSLRASSPSDSSRPTWDPPVRPTSPQHSAAVFAKSNGLNDSSLDDEQPVSFSFTEESTDEKFNNVVTRLAKEVGSQPMSDPMPQFAFGGREHIGKEAAPPSTAMRIGSPASNPHGAFTVGHTSKSSHDTNSTTPSPPKSVRFSGTPREEDREQQGGMKRVRPSTPAASAPRSFTFSASEGDTPKASSLAGGGWGADFMQKNQAQQKKAAEDIAKEIEDSKSGGGSGGSGGNVTSFAMPVSGSNMFGTAAAPTFGASQASTPSFTFGASASAAPAFGAGPTATAAPTPAFSFGAAEATVSSPGATPSSGPSFSSAPLAADALPATPSFSVDGAAPAQTNALPVSTSAMAASATIGWGGGMLKLNQAQQETAAADIAKEIDATKNGNGADASASPKPAFTFGASGGAATPVFGTPPSSAAAPAVPILFGAQSASASAPPPAVPGAFSFGGGPPVSSTLTTTEPKPSAAFAFGGSASALSFAAPASTVSPAPLFGGSASTSAPAHMAPSFLGSEGSAPALSPPPPTLFGSVVSATASGFGSSFGASGASPAPANPPGGAAVFATPASTVPGAFSFGGAVGASNPASSPVSAPTFGVFGASSPAPVFGSSSSAVFGQPATTGTLFGAAAAAAPGALFGGSPGMKMDSLPSGFSAANAQSTSSLFGSATPASNTSPIAFVFGGGASPADVSTTTHNPFGASLAPSTALFGAPVANPPASVGSVFGAGSQNMGSTPPASFAFNAASASPAPVFGGVGASPAFGAPGGSPAPFPFGSDQGASLGVPGTDLAAPSFGFSMGGAGDTGGGGKRRVMRKAKRPGK